MIYGITLIILGLLAAPSLIVKKSPQAGELLNKLVPYQGWIGLVFAFWGVWGIIQAILNIGLLTDWPIWWITWMASVVIEAILGFLLGYSLIVKYVLSKNEAAAAKGEELLKKLAPMQGTFGLVGVIVGIWVIVASILFVG